MTGFLYRMRLKIQTFMRGRYGMDLFNQYLIYTVLALDIVNLFFHNIILSVICNVFLVYFLFRFFSKNYVKRSIENRTFSEATAVSRRRGKAMASGLKDRNHRYFLCPNCHQMVRVPKGRGKIVVTCPKCRHEFTKRS